SRRPASFGASPRPAKPSAAARRAGRGSGPAILPMVIMAAFAAVAAALFIGILGVYGAYTSGLPPVDELEEFTIDEGSQVFSADDVELATFAAEQRQVVPYDEIPQLLIDAQVAAEYQSFWTNPCIDFRSIPRAPYQNLTSGTEVSGVSTICQQLVRIRLFDADLMADP